MDIPAADKNPAHVRSAQQSTEYHYGYAGIILACFYCLLDDFGVSRLSWLICAIGNLYTVGRTLYKANRRLYLPGKDSSEFKTAVFLYAWAFGAFWAGLSGFEAAAMTAISSGVYSVCAGKRKSLSQNVRVNIHP